MRGAISAPTKPIQIKLTGKGAVQKQQLGGSHQDTAEEEEEIAEEEEQPLQRRLRQHPNEQENHGSGPGVDRTPVVTEAMWSSRQLEARRRSDQKRKQRFRRNRNFTDKLNRVASKSQGMRKLTSQRNCWSERRVQKKCRSPG